MVLAQAQATPSRTGSGAGWPGTPTPADAPPAAAASPAGCSSPRRARGGAAGATEAALERFRRVVVLEAAATRAAAHADRQALVHGQPLEGVVRSVSPQPLAPGGTREGTEARLRLWRGSRAGQAPSGEP